MLRLLPALLLLAACASSSQIERTGAPAPAATVSGQRILPYPVMESANFTRAVESGTRTRAGAPGPNYWQQWSSYDIAASYDPASGKLTGRETIRYENRSPDSLRVLFLQLYDNVFEPSSMKNRVVPTTGGVEIMKLVANGTTLTPFDRQNPRGYRISGTIMQLPLGAPLRAGATATLELEWTLTVPPDGAPRGGRNDNVSMVSYWYPQMAVYDDVNGWQLDQYMTNAEFYMGYGSYRVALTVPASHVVAATGTLANPADVLTANERRALDVASTSDTIVIVKPASTDPAAGPSGTTRTWRFTADTVRDFSWATSARWQWDATSAVVGDRNGDGRADRALIQSYWLPTPGSAWSEGARYSKFSIEFLSRFLWPYPWPQMSSVNGPDSCGGMEYPMLTCINSRSDTLSLFGVVLHELGHMWFPMQVGSDEKRYSWQDEGFTSFNEANGAHEFLNGQETDYTDNRNGYLGIARSGLEVEIMRYGDLYPNRDIYGVATYSKTATVLDMLRSVLGDETFMRGLRAYGKEWQYKHPTPLDFFNAMETAAGKDLDWFWRPWFYETWQLDQAVASVTPTANGTDIVIEDRGLVIMPATLAVTYEGGATDTLRVPVETWTSGATRAVLHAKPGVAKVEIDPAERFADVDRGNNSWPASER